MLLSLFLIALLTSFATLIGVSVGFGLSTIMIPIMILFYPMQPVLLLVGVIHWFSNIWKLILFRQGLLWTLIFAFGIPGIIATIIGSLLSLHETQRFLSQFLGVVLFCYVLFIVFNPRFKVKKGIPYAIIGGLSAGFLAGIVGFRGAIRATFLSTFNLKKETFITTGAAISLAVDTARISTYYLGGTRISFIPYWSIFLLLLVSWITSFFARYIVQYIPQAKFRQFILFFLFIMSLKLFFFP